MVRPILMPKLGQSEAEAQLLRWVKREGDKVSPGEILFEIETDKAALEVESFFEGTLLKILVSDGETVPVQSTVGYLGDPGEAVPEVASRAVAPAAPASVPAPAPASPRVERVPAPQPVVLLPVLQTPPRFRISPRAKRLARESAIDPGGITGSGFEGRVVERDVQAHLEVAGYEQLRITPAAKRLAIDEKIDILKIRRRDASTRIEVRDIRLAMAEKPKPMSRMRQIIAERLTQSFTSAPHFFLTVEVDMTGLIEFRAELKREGRPYSVTDFIAAAVTRSLTEFPAVNSTTDGRSSWWHSKVQLGLAVSLENGLVVPVIRDADDLTLAEIHDEAARLIARARAGELKPEEMTGSTFTISNLGMQDVESFTAIINPGESAILAVSRTVQRPAVKDGQIVIRDIMKMTLSSDHRIIDGATAAQFAHAIKSKLEEAGRWKRLI